MFIAREVEMRKIIVMISVIAVCFGVLFGVAACTKEEEKGEQVCYQMNLSLSDNILEGTETVTITNVYQDGLSETVFHLYPNAYAENAVHPAYEKPLDVYGGVTVSSVRSTSGSDLVFHVQEDGEYMTVEHSPVKEKDEISFTIDYTVTIPSGNLLFSHNGDDYSLSSFYPQLAIYGEEGFRRDPFTTIGDPNFSSCASYDVTLECDSKQVVAASLPCRETVTNEARQTVRFVGDNVRDFAMALSPDYNVKSGKAGEVTVYYFHKNDENADETLATAINAITVFSNAFGEYPYEAFSVARVPFKEEGMEYTGLVYLSDKSADVNGTVIHETAHQWWYGVVGSDCINESYMDEGLTTFCSIYYYELTGDHERYESELKSIRRAYGCYERLQQKRKTDANLSMNKSVYDYTDYQYTMVQYYKGCMMFANLYELSGREKFDKGMRSYYEDNKFCIAGKDAFISSVKGQMGDVSGLMEGWLGERIVATTFAEAE